MLKYLSFTGLMYVIITPIMGLLDYTFFNTSTPMNTLIGGTFHLAETVITPWTWIQSIIQIVSFNYISLSDSWTWVRFVLVAVVAFPIVYGVIMNARGSSPT